MGTDLIDAGSHQDVLGSDTFQSFKGDFIMAKKPTPASSGFRAASRPAIAAKPAPTTSAVRNSAIPKPASASNPSRQQVSGNARPPRQITYEMIARRAYEIHCSGTGASQDDNWFRAERELRGGL
jgi:hypothetical protein